MAETRTHNPKDCDCETCYPASVPSEAPDPCACLEDGFRAGLEAWKESCSCCFSEAYPDGIDAAIARAQSRAG